MKPIERVSLEQIDLFDETFSVNFMPDMKRLRSSISQVGLTQPVLLRETSNRYQIVSGFRRISIFRELGHTEIDSRSFGEREMDDLSLFRVSLHENVTTRGFNTVEKAIALEKLAHHFKFDPSVLINEFLPLLDLETSEKVLNTFLSLAEMEEELKAYVLREEVSRSNIRRLAAFSIEDRKVALPLLTSLKLGENRLREVLTLIEEITRRDHCSVREITDHPEVQAILFHPEFTSAQKTEKVKKVLLSLRYPRMSLLEEQFEKRKRDLNLPPSISLNHPSFFEGQGLRIGFQFLSIEEYRSVLSSLSVLAEEKGFQEMIQDPSPVSSPARSLGKVKENESIG